MISLFMLLGALSLILSSAAWRANSKMAAAGRGGPSWRTLYRFWWIPALCLGVGSFFIAYPYSTSARYTVHGFPFPAYAFDESGSDYVGVLTPVFMALNFVCCGLFPQIVLWLAIVLKW